MKIFAAHNLNQEIRQQSSSGGVFSLLAKKIIAEGGIVYGAAFNDSWEVVHRRINTLDDLNLLRGSKYVFSQVGDAYNNAIEDLESGRKVLFSGTPCQIAALHKRAGDNPLLFLVEIVCHGAPQPKYWTRYLKELCSNLDRRINDIASINFRDKVTGWQNYSITIRFADGKIFTQPHDDNLYLRAFLQDLTLREACFRCLFKYPHGSKADITIGDFWGLSHILPEIDNNYGTSLVIVRNEKYSDVINGPNLFSKQCTSFDKVSQSNPALIRAAKKPKNYENFKEKADKSLLVPLLKKFVGKPIISYHRIYLFLAKLKHKILG